MSKTNRRKVVTTKQMSRAERKKLRERKTRSRKARNVKRRAKVVGVTKVNIEPLRKRLLSLCKQWRREQREINNAREVGNKQAVLVHEQNKTRIEHEMRRALKVIKAIPLPLPMNGSPHEQR